MSKTDYSPGAVRAAKKIVLMVADYASGPMKTLEDAEGLNREAAEIIDAELTRLTAQNAELVKALEFMVSKADAVLRTHICVDHGSSYCSDRVNLIAEIEKAQTSLASVTPEDEGGDR